MPTFEMVCLANSRKRKGRCVAGLRTDGQGWIRPIGSNAEGVLHPYHYTLHNNTEAQVLDVLRVDCSRACATPHHPEDWIAQPVSWRLLSRPVSSKQLEWLRSHLAAGPHLLGCTREKILHSVLQTRPAAQSLALVAPHNLQWQVKIGEGGERKIRAVFTLDGAEYNLPLTDPVWEGRLQHLPPGIHPRQEARPNLGDDVWLTVSLSEPFAPEGSDEEHCYKLAAAVIVVPHTSKTTLTVNGAAGASSPAMRSRVSDDNATQALPIQSEGAGRSAKDPFPASPAEEKTPHTKPPRPGLSAYPDPFAGTAPDQAEMVAPPTPVPAETSHKAATGKAAGERASNKKAAEKKAADAAPLNAPLLKAQADAPSAPSASFTVQNDRPAPLEVALAISDAAVKPPETNAEVKAEVSSEAILGSASEAKPLTRFDTLRRKVPRALSRWTPEEDVILLEQTQTGGSLESIATHMQRHEGEVRKRLEKFGLIEAEQVEGKEAEEKEAEEKANAASGNGTRRTQGNAPQSEQPTQQAATQQTAIQQAAPQAVEPIKESAGAAGVGKYSMSDQQVRTSAKEHKAKPLPACKAQAADTIRVVVCGAAGRMGREVVKAVVEADGLHLISAVDTALAGTDAGELAGLGKIGVVIETDLEAALKRHTSDVLIDFTLPDSVKRNALLALDNRISPVIGTTGLSASDLSTLDALAKANGIGAFIAPNFAIGAVLAMQFAAQAARYLPDVEIIELHHEKKLDSPSGTALLTARKIAQARQEAGQTPLPAPANTIEKAPGARGARHANTGDIPVHSIRLPGFVAHQEVIFGGQGEILTIRHDSIHRSSFMPGVVLAVRKVRALNGLVIGLENLLT